VTTEGDFADRMHHAGASSTFHGSPEDLVTMVAGAFGVPIAAEGCDARLAVEISARLVSASYGDAGTCFEGSEAQVTATLSMSGRSEATGEHTHRREPASSIQDCTLEPVVGQHLWAAMLAGDGSGLDDQPGALVDLFGDPIWLAINLAGRPSSDADRPGVEFEDLPGLAAGGNHRMLSSAVGVPPDADAIAVLTARVADSDRAARYFGALAAAHLAGEDPTARRALNPLVPYLIRALALEDGWETAEYGAMHSGKDGDDLPPLRGVLGSALSRITGRDLDARADLWWRWLRERGRRGTALDHPSGP
jgi:hypothetical protein